MPAGLFCSKDGWCDFLGTDQESHQRSRHRGGAEAKSFASSLVSDLSYPDFEPPSPMYPFRPPSEVWSRSGLNGEICGSVVTGSKKRCWRDGPFWNTARPSSGTAGNTQPDRCGFDAPRRCLFPAKTEISAGRDCISSARWRSGSAVPV